MPVTILHESHGPDTEFEVYLDANWSDGTVTLTFVTEQRNVTIRGPLGLVHRAVVKGDLLLTREAHTREDDTDG